jgi:hypothetical protein
MLKLMTHKEKPLVCLVAALAICTAANAATPDPTAGGPYHGIVERNVFGLHDPPPPLPPPDPEKSKPPPPPLILTGVSTIFGKAKALFKVSMPAKPGEPAKELFPIIAEGGPPEDNIEVIHIDVNAGIVQAKYYGVATNLTIKVNGPKIASALPPAIAAPGMPPPVGGLQPPPAFNPPGGGMRTIPSRSLRLPGGSSNGAHVQGTPGAEGAMSGAGAAGTQASLSSGAATGSTAPNPNTHMQPGLNQLSPEQYATLLELERERTKQDVLNGKMAPLPVTH